MHRRSSNKSMLKILLVRTSVGIGNKNLSCPHDTPATIINNRSPLTVKQPVMTDVRSEKLSVLFLSEFAPPPSFHALETEPASRKMGKLSSS